MEAKDTIIKIDYHNRHKPLQEKLLEQAEISFKAGGREMFTKLRKYYQVGVGIFDWNLEQVEVEFLYKLGKPNSRLE